MNADGWETIYTDTTDNTYQFDIWKFLTSNIDETTGSKVYAGSYNVSSGNVKSMPAIGGLFVTQIINNALQSTTAEYATIYIQQNGDEKRAVLTVGSTEQAKLNSNFPTDIPIILQPSSNPFEKAVYTRGANDLYENLTGDTLNFLQKCEIRITVDSKHEENGDTYYLWYDGDQLMATPVVYPNDKIEVGIVTGILGLNFENPVEVPQNIYPINGNEFSEILEQGFQNEGGRK